jgi:hypothetical protein
MLLIEARSLVRRVSPTHLFFVAMSIVAWASPRPRSGQALPMSITGVSPVAFDARAAQLDARNSERKIEDYTLPTW